MDENNMEKRSCCFYAVKGTVVKRQNLCYAVTGKIIKNLVYIFAGKMVKVEIICTILFAIFFLKILKLQNIDVSTFKSYVVFAGLTAVVTFIFNFYINVPTGFENLKIQKTADSVAGNIYRGLVVFVILVICVLITLLYISINEVNTLPTYYVYLLILLTAFVFTNVLGLIILLIMRKTQDIRTDKL